MRALAVRVVLLALAGPMLCMGTPAHAGEAPGDSLLNAYVRSMKDWTDALFGTSAAPVDTAGLDSALAAGLLHPPGWHGGRRHRLGFDWGPSLGFNRVDGGQLGLSATVSTPRTGDVSGKLQYTTGTKDWLGEGAWSDSWPLDALRSRLGVRLAAGRYTPAFDRDGYEPILTSLNALFAAQDYHHYLRRDGFIGSLRLSGEEAYATVGWRDQLESPLPYTTSWFLFGHGPVVPFNDTATFGRMRELSLGGDVTLPRTRFRVNGEYWTSDPSLGSDMLYRRTRVSAGGDISVGRHFSLVPQATYGILRGETPPQEAFYLGGVGNLRTLKRNELAGAGRLFGRVDLILVDELERSLHIPIPGQLPVQFGLFMSSGAVWGRDPASGDAVPTTRVTPRRDEFLSEVGAGLMWRLGIPRPLTSLRIEVAFPLGADRRGVGYTAAYQEPLNLLPWR